MKPPSLARRIRADIEERIRSGAWPPGHRLPTEHALLADYGCARMTVSKAMGALAAAGLIERRNKAGSFVAHPQVHAAVLEIPDLRAVIEARGETYAYQGLRRAIRRLNPADPDEAALGAPGEALALVGLHVAHGAPFAVERRVIALAAVPEAAAMDFGEEAPGSWLLRQVPWTEAEHRITAVNPTPAEARRLAVGRSAACLQVKRWTWRQGQGITFVTQLFPGGAYDLVARFGADRR
ncbi:MAG: histidine utilization repressor [Caulobacteraceae bacterium]|nr:histidine utilization repressor [Caulobacteraceae bacterium]